MPPPRHAAASPGKDLEARPRAPGLGFSSRPTDRKDRSTVTVPNTPPARPHHHRSGRLLAAALAVALLAGACTSASGGDTNAVPPAANASLNLKGVPTPTPRDLPSWVVRRAPPTGAGAPSNDAAPGGDEEGNHRCRPSRSRRSPRSWTGSPT